MKIGGRGRRDKLKTEEEQVEVEAGRKGQVENRGRTSGRLRQEGRDMWKPEEEQVEGWGRKEGTSEKVWKNKWMWGEKEE